MKNILRLGAVFFVFLLASPQVSAQTDHQKALWQQATEEVNQLATKTNLTEKQKKFATRSFYNYHERLEALEKGIPNLPFQNKAEVSKKLFKRMKEVLSTEQFTTFKSIKSKLLDDTV